MIVHHDCGVYTRTCIHMYFSIWKRIDRKRTSRIFG